MLLRYALSVFGSNGNIKKPLQRKIAAVSMLFRHVVLVSGLNDNIKNRENANRRIVAMSSLFRFKRKYEKTVRTAKNPQLV
jgi:hypothetical protein